MLILALETSCDETAAAVVRDGTHVLSNIISSQQNDFASTGGVIPEAAARKQVELILPVIHQAMKDAQLKPDALEALAVTKGPGLLTSLLVGTTAGRTLASLWHKPIIGVHHTLGHLSSVWLSSPKGTGTRGVPVPTFPCITLSASGGHTDLWYRKAHTQGTLLGRTRDDAAGEAFDKGALQLGLPYPGGPSIAKAAETGNRSAYQFPLPLRNDPSLDFSFSGLKTALKYRLREIRNPKSEIRDLAASYQEAICLHLVDRIVRALKKHSEAKEIHLVGGVSANTRLRELVSEACALPIRTPVTLSYCTDNAAMIGAAAYFLHQELGENAFEKFETNASLPLASVPLAKSEQRVQGCSKQGCK